MIFVTGDTHADYTRFATDSFPEQRTLSKSDYVIICGDFGIWDGSKEENYWLDWLEQKPFTTLFIDGNHENYDLLGTFPVTQWHGGLVQHIRPSVIHLMRGQLYEIDGKRIFTMGGAASHDIEDGILEPDAPDYKQKRTLLEKQGKLMYRVNHRSWWQEEMPSDTEYDTARKTLDACGWEVDFIFTHCGPTSVITFMSKGFYQADRLTDFLEEINQKCDFKYWFFGHYHDNRQIIEKHICLYEQILELPEKALFE